jgi:glycosyltransferase involved in cell wall biosynthesis
MKDRPGISLLVHTRDSAATLPRLLETTSWLDERVVIDMSSTDGTAEMARDAGCRVVTIPAEPFNDALRNRHLESVAHPWTMVLDSDEHLADDAEREFRTLLAGQPDDVAGFWIPRFNSIAGRVLRGSGWYPDHQLRLFRTGSVRYSQRHHVPPSLVDDRLATVRLQPPHCPHIHHLNYDSLVAFMERQLHYAVTDLHNRQVDEFAFEDYLARAVSEFDKRHQPDVDGDLSYALAVLMYWNQMVRGLVHWERLDRLPPLPHEPPPLFMPQPTADPAAVARAEHAEAEIEVLRRRVKHLRRELNRFRNSRSVRLTRPLRFVGRVMRRLRRRIRRP